MVENGYVHEDFRKEAMKLNWEIQESKAKTSIVKAWDMFNESFDDNEQDIVTAFHQVISENTKFVSVAELCSVVQFLRELRKDELADEIINLYAEKRGDEKRLFSLKDQPFGHLVKDRKVSEVFNKVSKDHEEKRTLREVSDKISQKDGWGSDDEGFWRKQVLKTITRCLKM